MYDGGIRGALSACILALAIGFQDYLEIQQMSSSSQFKSFAVVGTFAKLRIILDANQLGTALLYMLANLLLPRRPDVFLENGNLVDRQFTTSAFGRYTFQWCDGLLKLAQRKVLDMADLPRPDHLTRAENLQKSFLAIQRKGPLWKIVFLAHWPSFVSQWFLTIFQCLFQFGRPFALWNLLYILELRTEGQDASIEAWIWTAALCLCLAIGSWIESWLLWVSISQLAIPIRAQLSAIIFQKAMWRKDVKAGHNKVTKSAKTKTNDPEHGDVGTGSNLSDLVSVTDKEDDVQGSKQSTINLIAVDAMRVSGFCVVSNFPLRSIIQLSISLTFLVNLIGWRALLAGLAAFTLTMPLNIVVSNKYAAIQNTLMKVRDEKMDIITEAVQGRRQIKFSALERQWQSKISKVRAKELDKQWRVASI
jgi:hypothetical protein